MAKTEQSKVADITLPNVAADSQQQAVAATKTNLPAVANLEEMLAADAGTGQENVRTEDLAIPFLGLLQSGNPQVKKSSPPEVRIEGAEEGMILNTVTKELYKVVEVIPCFFNAVLIEWKDRDLEGGGFVKLYPDPNDPIIKEAKPHSDPKKANVLTVHGTNVLVPTNQHYVLFKDNQGQWNRAIVAMTSSKLGTSRRWNSLMSMEKILVNGEQRMPPTYSRRYTLKTSPKSKGENSWWVFDVEKAGPVEDVSVYMEARRFYEAVKSGAVQVTPPDMVNDDQDGAKQPASQTTAEEREAAKTVL